MSFRLITTPVKIAIQSIFLLSLSGLALAENETQMITKIGGEISVEANGDVRMVSLKNVKDAKLEKYFIGIVKSWKFYPMEINGEPVAATSDFTFNLIATYNSDKSLREIEFNNVIIEPNALEIEIIKKSGFKLGKKTQISYPKEALMTRADADVILAVEISSDGKVSNSAVYDIGLKNVDYGDSVALSRAFSNAALHGVRQWQWASEELIKNKCINGCVSLVNIYFIMDGSGGWKRYQHIPQAPIPWVVASQLKDMDKSEKSQLVRLKDDPTGKPIDLGG